jgi:hypothetical protein
MAFEFRRIIGNTLAAILVFNLSPGRTQEPASISFVSGETLTYDVSWSIFRAGEVVAKLRKVGEGAAEAYEIDTSARSQGFASVLFRVQDEFQALINPQTLCSRQISKKVSEGRRRKETKIVFDRAERMAILDERDLATPNAAPKHAENAIPPCVEDIVTAFYFLRQQSLRVGQNLIVPVNDGGKTYQVSVEVQARERIQTPFGNRDAFRMEPKAFQGLSKRISRMVIWISDDAERLPLRIKALISVGSITGDLKSVNTEPSSPSTATK